MILSTHSQLGLWLFLGSDACPSVGDHGCRKGRGSQWNSRGEGEWGEEQQEWPGCSLFNRKQWEVAVGLGEAWFAQALWDKLASRAKQFSPWPAFDSAGLQRTVSTEHGKGKSRSPHQGSAVWDTNTSQKTTEAYVGSIAAITRILCFFKAISIVDQMCNRA